MLADSMDTFQHRLSGESLAHNVFVVIEMVFYHGWTVIMPILIFILAYIQDKQ